MDHLVPSGCGFVEGLEVTSRRHGGNRVLDQRLHVVPGLLRGSVVILVVPAPLVQVQSADIQPTVVYRGEFLVMRGGEGQEGPALEAVMQIADAGKVLEHPAPVRFLRPGRFPPKDLTHLAGNDGPEEDPCEAACLCGVNLGVDGQVCACLIARQFAQSAQDAHAAPAEGVQFRRGHGIEIRKVDLDPHAPPQRVFQQIHPAFADPARLG